MISRRFLFACFLCCMLLGAPSFHALSATADKNEVLAKYEQAMALTEENRVSKKDVQDVLPRIRFAGQALLKSDFQTADRVLTGVLSDLEEMQKKQSPETRTEFRLEWLETYVNVFQWFAVLALLAFFFVKWPLFQDMLLKNRIPWWGRGTVALLATFFAVLLSVFDLSRYGASSWMFFDIQIVLLTVGGLFGGIVAGLASGVLVAVFRLTLEPGWSVYPVLSIAAGLLGGVFSMGLKNFQETLGRRALGAGLLIGILHGVCVYLPVDPSVSPGYLVFAILLLAVLEGTGVFLFATVVAGILREENQRRMQHEFLKTRLLFLQAQLRPHFFFNALNTISTICVRENASRAQGLILKLADFLRHTLKRENETATFREEISFIEDYLEIEKARFQDRLQIMTDYKVQEATWQARIPLLILQPLVENAVRHGIQKKPEGGYVRIHAEDVAGVLKVEIEDNGLGADPLFFERMLRGEKTQVEGLGIGVRNIHERLKRTFGNEASLSFKTVLGEGTRATVVIPLSTETRPVRD